MTEKSGAEPTEGELPAIDFVTFVLSLNHSALVYLGAVPDPSAAGAAENAPMAKQTIDLLSVLQEKTRGNLTGEEERLLDQVLYELRLRYLEMVKRK
jgi:hypothetical protein